MIYYNNSKFYPFSIWIKSTDYKIFCSYTRAWPGVLYVFEGAELLSVGRFYPVGLVFFNPENCENWASRDKQHARPISRRKECDSSLGISSHLLGRAQRVLSKGDNLQFCGTLCAQTPAPTGLKFCTRHFFDVKMWFFTTVWAFPVGARKTAIYSNFGWRN